MVLKIICSHAFFISQISCDVVSQLQLETSNYDKFLLYLEQRSIKPPKNRDRYKYSLTDLRLNIETHWTVSTLVISRRQTEVLSNNTQLQIRCHQLCFITVKLCKQGLLLPLLVLCLSQSQQATSASC